MVKKVELHTHLEGTAPPSLIKKIAQRNGVNLNEAIFSKEGDYFVWNNFLDFLAVYEQASNAIKQPQDYYDITLDYLRRCAEQDCIYVEMMYSPEHAERASGIPSLEHVKAIADAICHAQQRYKVVGRLIYTAVRHYGVEACEKVALQAHKEPHEYIVGFGLGGDEVGFPPTQFERAYQIARDAGLGCSAHAGEMDGPEKIVHALDKLKLTRLGHAVRSIEDEQLLARLKGENIHLEVCPTSNIALKVYPDYASHPLRKFYEYGLSVSLNSDDPPYFRCSVGEEYEIAKQQFGFNDDELKHISLMAMDAAFVDDFTKQMLKKRILEEH